MYVGYLNEEIREQDLPALIGVAPLIAPDPRSRICNGWPHLQGLATGFRNELASNEIVLLNPQRCPKSH